MIKRHPDGTTAQQRAWLALRDASCPLSAAELAALLGKTDHAARSLLEYLEARGLAARVDSDRRVYYHVLGRRPPADRRGKPARCRNHRGRTAYASWLRMMRVKRGKNWMPKPKDPLSRAWVGA